MMTNFGQVSEKIKNAKRETPGTLVWEKKIGVDY